jgi:hypothetical protein
MRRYVILQILYQLNLCGRDSFFRQSLRCPRSAAPFHTAIQLITGFTKALTGSYLEPGTTVSTNSNPASLRLILLPSSSSSSAGFYNPLAGFSLLILEVSRSQFYYLTISNSGKVL